MEDFLETGWAGTSFDFLAGLQLLRFLTVDKRPLNNGCGVPGIPTSLQNILQPRGVGWRGCVADNNYKRWRIVDPLILLEARAEPEATICNYSLHVDWSIESSVSLHKECRATPTFVHLWLKYFQGESWSISQEEASAEWPPFIGKVTFRGSHNKHHRTDLRRRSKHWCPCMWRISGAWRRSIGQVLAGFETWDSDI